MKLSTIGAAIAAPVMAFGLVVGPSVLTPEAAPQAEAGTACNLSGHVFCGEILNSLSSINTLHVTYSWGDFYATDRYLARGENSNRYGVDADGFRVRAGEDVICYRGRGSTTYTATGTYKITDLDDITCIVKRQP